MISKPILLSLLLIFAGTQTGMAIDVYMRIIGQNEFAEEGIPNALYNAGFFRLGSVSLGAENVINIGSTTGGGGAGKAIFKELQINKSPGKVSTDIFKKLVTGRSYDEVEIIIVRSEFQDPSAPPEYLMTFGMKLVMAGSLDYRVFDGDSLPEESITLHFGAIRMRYFKDDGKGGTALDSEALWSIVLNTATYSVN